MEQTDVLVVGGGVVGLAVAMKLTEKFEDITVILMEKHEKFGQETSSRNSEVIHSGIYYPEGSLKAELCVKGNRMLYEFCDKWNVPYKRTGKLIIARSEEEIPVIRELMEQGNKNGVFDLELLDKASVKSMEPNVNAFAALFSPSTGIVDSHRLMARLETNAKRNFAFMAYGHEVINAVKINGGYCVTYKTPSGEQDTVECRVLINSTGLDADKIPGLLEMDVDGLGYRIYPCKGEYFAVSEEKSAFINSLVYPPPLKALKGLGIHVTKSLDGRTRLGPSAFYTDIIDYNVDIRNAETFYNATKSFMPFLELTDLHPDMAGIRPKIQAPGDPVKDFIIRHEADRGLPGLINLLGIESPGLTSCLAIGEIVSDLSEKALQ